MVLSDQDILKFQALYKSEFGMEINKEDAYEKGIKLLRLMSIVCKPIAQKEFDHTQIREQEIKPLP